MKLNLEIELDWIEEDQTLDDVVKQQIISGVMSKISSGVKDGIEKKVNETIDKTVVDKINELTDNLFTEFTKRAVTVSDNYGDKIAVYDSVEALVKKRFDDFMEQKVDKNGEAYNRGSYGSSVGSRIEYIISEQLKSFADKFTKDAVDTVQKEIKLHVESGLKEHMGNKMMEVLDIQKLLQLKGS